MLIQHCVGKNSKIFSKKDEANDSKFVISLNIKVWDMNFEAGLIAIVNEVTYNCLIHKNYQNFPCNVLIGISNLLFKTCFQNYDHLTEIMAFLCIVIALQWDKSTYKWKSWVHIWVLWIATQRNSLRTGSMLQPEVSSA